MSVKISVLTISFFLLFISCDRTMLIKVGLDAKLTNENYSLVDYDFILADNGTSDKLYFECIFNKELGQGTTFTFFDRSGGIIDVVALHEANNITIESEIRSFVYSMALDNIRSEALIAEVVIGQP